MPCFSLNWAQTPNLNKQIVFQITSTMNGKKMIKNILKRTFGPIFESLYLKAAIRSHGFFSKI